MNYRYQLLSPNIFIYGNIYNAEDGRLSEDAK